MNKYRRHFINIGGAVGAAILAPALLSRSSAHANTGRSSNSGFVMLNSGDDLQALLDSGARFIVLDPMQTYIWNNIVLPSGTTIQGNGARVQTASMHKPILKTSQHTRNVLIKDVRFYGDVSSPINKKVYPRHIGIEIYKSSEITVEGCDFDHFLGAGVSIFNYTGNKMSTANRVSNCRFSKCQYGFLAWYYCEYGVLQGCHFTECRAAIFICSGNWLVSSNVVVDCRAAYISTSFPNQIAWNTGGNLSHGNVTGNTFNHSNDSPWKASNLHAGTGTRAYQGIHFEDVLPVTFTGNALWYTDITCIDLQDDFYITGCTLANSTVSSTGGASIFLTGCWIRSSVTLGAGVSTM